MPGLTGCKKRFAGTEMCFSVTQSNMATRSKVDFQLIAREPTEFYSVLPGLPDDVAKLCLAHVPRCYFPVMGTVSKRWRSFIRSKEFTIIRKEAGKLEEWLYVLTSDSKGKGCHWEVLGDPGDKGQLLPPMPGPAMAGFGVVVQDGNLFVMAGYSVDEGIQYVSDDVYQYESRLNRWNMIAKMNIARYDFACAEVDGLIYVVGGYGSQGTSLSSTEVYDPDTNKWTLIESIRRPRWGCFGCSFEGKLYVMGGRSNFTIGNSRFVDVYDPKNHSWCETRNGCVMVTTHAVLGQKLFCMEWKNQRKLAVFDPVAQQWENVPVPLTGSSTIGFRFGILDGKLLLFSVEEESGYQTLLYDPDASVGSEWRTSELKPTGLCLCTVTITA